MENLPVLAPQQKLPTGGRTVLRSFMMSVFVISLQVPRKGQLCLCQFLFDFFVEGKKVTNNLTKPKTFLMSYLKVIFIYFLILYADFNHLKQRKTLKSLVCIFSDRSKDTSHFELF